MGLWEKSISEGTYNGKPVWFFDYSGQIQFTFYKHNLELAEIWDVHTGEEAIYDSKKDLAETANNPKDYYHNLYMGARMDLMMYLKNPVAWKKKQDAVVAQNRRARMPQIKAYKAQEAERKKARAKADLERISKGAYAIKVGPYDNPKMMYADTLTEARKKLLAYMAKTKDSGFIYDNKTDTFVGRIDVIGGELFWTRTSPLNYTPLNRDGTLRNVSAYSHYVMLGGNKKLVYARSLDEARQISAGILSNINSTTQICFVCLRENSRQVGFVSKYRKPNGGYTYNWTPYMESKKKPLDPATGRIIVKR